MWWGLRRRPAPAGRRRTPYRNCHARAIALHSDE
jgi:hypothetical protein